MKKTNSRLSSPINVRKSRDVGNNGMNDGNEFDSRETKRNLSMINYSGMRFLTSVARVVFTKVLIIHHFDLKHQIRIKTDMSDFSIGRKFSQLTLKHITYTNLNLFNSKIVQLYSVDFSPRKVISAKIRYETHDKKLLTIFEDF